MKKVKLTRREFLITSTVTGGGLMIAFSLAGCEQDRGLQVQTEPGVSSRRSRRKASSGPMPGCPSTVMTLLPSRSAVRRWGRVR